jgi:uncharacterized membrane protein YqaE (UPF0057 family)
MDDIFILKNGSLLDTKLLSFVELQELRQVLANPARLGAGGGGVGGVRGLEIIPRMRGGGVLDMFSSILQIGKVFFFLLDLTIWFGKFIAWLVMFLIAVFKFMFVDLIFDFYNSIVLIVVSICKLPLDLLGGLFAWVMNGIGGWMTTIWGWDQSNLTKLDKNSKYFRGMDRNKGRKCYLTNNNKVPFSILLGTIICPPMGVFMDMGATGWLNILICIILTLMFYVPGLVYALLVIYS